MATSDLQEAKTLSHRMIVLHGGRIVADYGSPNDIPDIPGITTAMTALASASNVKETA